MQSNTLNSMMGTSWHSPGKIWNIGSIQLNTFFDESVLVEEKVDGSFFQFGVFNGELKTRSKGKELIVDVPEKLFNSAVNTAKELVPLLKEGFTYRAEYLVKPKHNVLAYDRTPSKFLIIHDILTNEETYLSYDEKKAEAERLGLEVVPKLFEGLIQHPQQFKDLMEHISILGGQKIEGIVCKNYMKFDMDKKVLMAKHVSEAFKEVHRQEWKEGNPGQNDIIQILIKQYNSKARWNKAIQHLKERGEYTNSPKDIGALIKEVQHDIILECKDDIKEALYKWAKDHILRGAVRGFPEWYKEELVKSQFETGCEWDATKEVLLTANPEE